MSDKLILIIGLLLVIGLLAYSKLGHLIKSQDEDDNKDDGPLKHHQEDPIKPGEITSTDFTKDPDEPEDNI